MNKQFDVIVGNPPYKGDTHLKILKKCVSIANERVVLVHPSAWLVKQVPPSKIEQECRDIVDAHITSFKFIKGKYYFGVVQYTPCSITHIQVDTKKTKKEIEIQDETNDRVWMFKSIDDINYISDSSDYFRLKDLLLKNTNSISDKLSSIGNFYVTIPKIRGSDNVKPNCKQGLFHKDFYTLISKTPTITTTAGHDQDCIGFKTKQEAENFIQYLKTNFARFCLSLLKFDANIRSSKMKAIPWMDFTRPWTDADLFAEFNLTNTQIKIINETIPDYY